MRIFQISFQIERAKLWDKELQIISKDTVEVWIDSTLLQILNGPWLMSVHPHHRLGYFKGLISPAESALDVQPLFESFDKCLFGHRLGLLAADAAAEHVVEAAAGSKETTGLRVVIFMWNNVFQELLTGSLVVLSTVGRDAGG